MMSKDDQQPHFVSSSKGCVLVIDDAALNRLAAGKTLRDAGYEVIEAPTGSQGMDLLNSSLDLILLDVNLPDMNGYDICRIIKAHPHYNKIPVIQTSATFIKGEDHLRGLSSGADAFLVSPVESWVLLTTVTPWIRARQSEKIREELVLSQKSANDELQQTITELHRERDVRETFVAALTHDLRNPLTAARMNAQLIQMKSGVDEKIQFVAKRVVANLDRADVMIRDLLDAGRIKAGEGVALDIGPQDIDSIVQSAIEDLKSMHGERFVFKSVDGPVTGFWDGQALRRVVDNLAGNAVKYGSPDGLVTISVLKDGTSVNIDIHNEGEPIPLKDQSTLFERYHRSDSAMKGSQKGWGIGLTLVRGLTNAHGGRVSMNSSRDTGTVFTVRIPLDSRSSL